MEEIAKKRGKLDKLYESMTINHWIYSNVQICESYEEIHKYIVRICSKNNIYIKLKDE